MSYRQSHLWLGPMGGCAGKPETDFLKPLSLSASPLPPGSPSLGTELARLDPWWRSEWSSLRLRRILPCGSLMLLLRQSRLITFWDTASSKRCRCFLGMKILANMVACEENERIWVSVYKSCLRIKKKERERGWIYIKDPPRSILKTWSPRLKALFPERGQQQVKHPSWARVKKWWSAQLSLTQSSQNKSSLIQINRLPPSELRFKEKREVFDDQLRWSSPAGSRKTKDRRVK